MSNATVAPEKTEGKVLTEKDLNKCGRRWCMSVNGFNYETQLAPSVVFAEADALKKIYGDDDEAYRKSLANAGKYFNATPPSLASCWAPAWPSRRRARRMPSTPSRTSRLALWAPSLASVTPCCGS